MSTGFILDKPDKYDYKLENFIYCSGELNFEEIDISLDECMPGIYESQGATNSCVPWSWTPNAELQISRIRKRLYNTNGLRFNNSLSKKFLYYMSRLVSGDGAEQIDGGSSFRYTAKALKKHGICTQSLYSDGQAVNVEPNFKALLNANEYEINAYYSITTLQGILASLKLRIPVQIGTNIDAFDDAKYGGYSAKSELWTYKQIANHGMLIVGTTFRNGKWCFKIRNSYGPNWGDNGHCYINAMQMWNYNIQQAMVFIIDNLPETLDKENPNYLQNQKIPTNTIILGNYIYDLDYANDPNNIVEIQDKTVLADNNVFVKTVAGEFIDNITGLPTDLSSIIARIGSSCTYKDKQGIVTHLQLRA